MNNVLLICLVVVAAMMMIWGIVKQGRLLQMPTLASVVILVLVIPQMLGICKSNGSALPDGVVADNGLSVALLVHVLFYATLGLGYIFYPVKPMGMKQPAIQSSTVDALIVFGWLLLAVSLFANWQLDQICGGKFLAFYRSETGNYTIEWRGLPVIYTNLKNLAYPALFCLLFGTLRSPTIFRWLSVLAAGFYPLLSIVLLWRRTPAMSLAITILMAYQFARKWNPPRWTVIIMVLLGGICFYSFTDYRETSPFEGAESNKTGLMMNSVQSAFAGDEKKTSELVGSINIISAMSQTHDFGWGRGIWNSTVEFLVPRQFVGETFKQSLKFYWNSNNSAEVRYGSGRGDYIAITGPCGAFAEFGYLGAIFFFVIGRISRFLWDRTIMGSVTAMLLYVTTTPIFILILFNDISQIVGYLAMSLIPITPLLWWISGVNQSAKHKTSRS